MNIGAIHRMTQGASAQTNYSSVQSLAVMRENELRYVRVQNCNFGGITSLAIFTRPIIDRSMSGYAQIAYFEAKHVRKRFSNEYQSLSVYRNPEARFEKFLSAYFQIVLKLSGSCLCRSHNIPIHSLSQTCTWASHTMYQKDEAF